MLSQQEKDIIKYGTDNGQSRDSIVAALTRFRENPPAKVGRFRETVGDIKETFGGMQEVLERRADRQGEIQRRERAGQGALSTMFQEGSNIMGLLSEQFGEAVVGAGKVLLSQEKEDAIKRKLTEVVQSDVVAPPVRKALDQYAKLKESNPEMAANLEGGVDVIMALLDMAGVGLAEKGAAKSFRFGKEALETGLEAGAKARVATEGLIQKGVRRIPGAADDISAAIRPRPTPVKAVGQVLQGTTEDIAAGARAISIVDTTNIKSFKELKNVLSAKIPALAKQVDSLLRLDPIRRTLKELELVSKSAGGKIVRENPVKESMNHLVELYTKTGRAVEAQEMKETISAAIREGLDSYQINQIARAYGREASGFSKVTGKPLTSVSAELYETTRKKLKTIARDSIHGKEAKALDLQLSDLYTTEKLIKKNVEAVNKLQQKIDKRGLLERIGHKFGKYADILTGGSIRGIMSGVLPRGSGQKVMNALDLEAVLERNLKIINDALKAKTDKEILELLEDLTNVKKASSATPKKKVATKKVSKVQKATTDYKKIKPIAEKAQKKINEIANKYVKKYGGDVADPGIKPEKSWVRKVVGELDGDSTRITDTARNSIVTTKPKAVYKDLLKRKDLVKSDFKTHLSNELGFEGGNVRLKIGDITAEIQVVTPDMVFAKEEAKIAKSMLGNSKYQEMLSSYGDIGGEGHTLYEKWRKLNPDSNKAQAIATRSKKYYNQFMK